MYVSNLFARVLRGALALWALAACGSSSGDASSGAHCLSDTFEAGSCAVSDGGCVDYGPTALATAARNHCARTYAGTFDTRSCTARGYVVGGIVAFDSSTGLCRRFAAQSNTDAGVPRD